MRKRVVFTHAPSTDPERDRQVDAILANAPDTFGSAGWTVDTEGIPIDQLQDHETLDKLRHEPAMIVALGGDGTALAAAAAAIETGSTLGVIPLGTANLLARDLGLEPDPDAAARQLATGTQARIDACYANDHLMLNACAFGLYPTLAETREKLREGEGGLAAWSEVIFELGSVVAEAEPAHCTLDIGSRRRRLRTFTLLITNNVFVRRHNLLLGRSVLDTGKLGIYADRQRSAFSALGLLSRLPFAAWKRRETIAETAAEVVVHFESDSVEANLDGETMPLDTPVKIRCHRRALAVQVPRDEAED